MNRSRVCVSGLFFLHGLCFSSWGVRIPAIQEMHSLSETELGTVLLTLPVGSILSMPLAAALVERFGSKRVLLASILMYASILVTLGLARSSLELMGLLVLFGLSSNLVNVSLNTQAVTVESYFGKNIMASLHGLWSLAGFFGAALGALMINFSFPPLQHFLIVFAVVFVGSLFCGKALISEATQEKKEKSKLFTLPDRSLLILGLIAFFSMLCEGTMFDWSGIYFRKVVNAEGGWVSAGYVAFMTTMAGTRFVADTFQEKLGAKKILALSGSLVFSGLLLAVILPSMVPSIAGFFLVGMGVSAVVPLALGQAGKQSKSAPSVAIATVSTVGFFGFLFGPPLIGWVAGLTNLRVSFLIIAFMGLGIVWLSKKVETQKSE